LLHAVWCLKGPTDQLLLQHIAFMDMGQVNPGHVIVSLKSHCKTILDLNEDQAGAIFQIVNRVAKAVQQEFRPDGMTIL